MEVLKDIRQGTEDWLKARLECFTASELPAAAGKSKYQKREELLDLKVTGIAKEVDASTQRLFDRGHAAEDAARPLIEEIIGDELYPCVGKRVIDGIPLLASFDGLTMLGDTGFEHKLFNESLAAQIQAVNDGTGELDEHYTFQLDHQLLVSEAERIIFGCSNGDEGSLVYCTYENPGEDVLIERVIPVWKQFIADMANHQPVVHAPAPAAQVIPALPTLQILVAGEVKGSNLEAYQATALQFVDSISTELVNDQDFADAAAAVKFLKTTEDEIKAAKEQALSQTADIRDLFNALDTISEAMRQKRLALSKLEKAEKERRRYAIVSEAQNSLADHVATINEKLGRVQLPVVAADFAGAMKGKKTIKSLQEAANNELARAKIEATRLGDHYGSNLESFDALVGEYLHLFPDLRTFIGKAPDDFDRLVSGRISEAQQAEKERQASEAKAQKVADEKAEKEALDKSIAAAADPDPDKEALQKVCLPALDDNYIQDDIDELLELANELRAIRLPELNTAKADLVGNEVAAMINKTAQHIEIRCAQLQRKAAA